MGKTPWYKNFYNWYLIFLTLIVVLPILAPIFMQIGWTGPAKLIYFLFSFTCHQFHHRSLHLFDYQMAWCARDVAIWTGIWIVAILIKYKKIKPVKFYWLIPFTIPIALDGGIQTIATILEINPVGLNTGMPLYISTNLSRFLTGAIFGIGLSLWISPNMIVNPETTRKSKQEESLTTKPKKELLIERFREPLKIITLVLAMFLLYISFVFLWNVTSEYYKPEGWLDVVARQPEEDFVGRRKNAPCPTEGEDDLIKMDCFWGR